MRLYSYLSLILLRLGLLALLLSGCAESDGTELSSEEIGYATSDIIGGKAETRAAYDSVVFLVINNNELCTGSLISPRVVLTAKHCIVNATPATVVVGAGNAINAAKRYGTVTDIRTTSDTAIEGKDIAVVLLDKEGTLTTQKWAKNTVAYAGKTVGLVGFGQQQVGQSGTGTYGTKMSTTTTVLVDSNVEFAIAGPSTCFGDSGGPVFLDGNVIGVVSRGQANCTGSSVMTRVSAFQDLINKAISDTTTATQTPQPQPPTPVVPAPVAPVMAVGDPPKASDAPVDSMPLPDKIAESQNSAALPASSTESPGGCSVADSSAPDFNVFNLLLLLGIVMRARRNIRAQRPNTALHPGTTWVSDFRRRF